MLQINEFECYAYGIGYSMAIVLDHRSTATSSTGNFFHLKVRPYSGVRGHSVFHYTFLSKKKYLDGWCAPKA